MSTSKSWITSELLVHLVGPLPRLIHWAKRLEWQAHSIQLLILLWKMAASPKKSFAKIFRRRSYQWILIVKGSSLKEVSGTGRLVIRSYEVGPDKTATLESILNLLQVMLNYSFQVHAHAQKHERSLYVLKKKRALHIILKWLCS